jgi:hypothetical protein
MFYTDETMFASLFVITINLKIIMTKINHSDVLFDIFSQGISDLSYLHIINRTNPKHN